MTLGLNHLKSYLIPFFAEFNCLNLIEIDNLATPGDSEDHLKTCLRQQNDSFWVKILNDSISMYTRWATGIEALPPCVGRSLDLPYLDILIVDGIRR